MCCEFEFGVFYWIDDRAWMSKTIIDVKHFEFRWSRIPRNCCNNSRSDWFSKANTLVWAEPCARWAELKMLSFWAGGISSFPPCAREYRLLRRLNLRSEITDSWTYGVLKVQSLEPREGWKYEVLKVGRIKSIYRLWSLEFTGCWTYGVLGLRSVKKSDQKMHYENRKQVGHVVCLKQSYN